NCQFIEGTFAFDATNQTPLTFTRVQELNSGSTINKSISTEPTVGTLGASLTLAGGRTEEQSVTKKDQISYTFRMYCETRLVSNDPPRFEINLSTDDISPS